MTYLKSWDEFSKAAEKLYLADPMKARFVIKYCHSAGKLTLKVTDDQVYRSENAQDLKKLEKLMTLFMRHMASKDPHHQHH